MFRPELNQIYEPTVERGDTTTVVWCHGGGSQPESAAVLAPYFRNCRFILPTGAIASVNGGYDWVRLLDSTELTLDDNLLMQHVQGFGQWLHELKLVSPGALVLGGLSQGAIFAGVVALHAPRLMDGLFVLSGFVPRSAASVSLQGLPVFVAHGDADPLIPPQLAADTANLFLSLGAAVDHHVYSMGHDLDDQEVADLTAWISRFRQQAQQAPTASSSVAFLRAHVGPSRRSYGGVSPGAETDKSNRISVSGPKDRWERLPYHAG